MDNNEAVRCDECDRVVAAKVHIETHAVQEYIVVQVRHDRETHRTVIPVSDLTDRGVS